MHLVRSYMWHVFNGVEYYLILIIARGRKLLTFSHIYDTWVNFYLLVDPFCAILCSRMIICSRMGRALQSRTWFCKGLRERWATWVGGRRRRAPRLLPNIFVGHFLNTQPIHQKHHGLTLAKFGLLTDFGLQRQISFLEFFLAKLGIF